MIKHEQPSSGQQEEQKESLEKPAKPGSAKAIFEASLKNEQELKKMLAENVVATREKEETSIDTEFIKEADHFFDNKKEVIDELADKETNQNNKEALERYSTFLNEMNDILNDLAKPEKEQDVQFNREKYVFAISVFAETMAGYSQWAKDDDLNKEANQKYQEAKKLFMECCSKLYGETNPGLAALSIKKEFNKINGIGSLYSDSGEGINISENIMESLNEGNLQQNPKEVLQIIDSTIQQFSAQIEVVSHRNFDNQDEAQKQQTQIKVDGVMEVIYKLNLIRNKLVKQEYQNANLSPIEVEEIEQAMKKI